MYELILIQIRQRHNFNDTQQGFKPKKWFSFQIMLLKHMPVTCIFIICDTKNQAFVSILGLVSYIQFCRFIFCEALVKNVLNKKQYFFSKR